ncbi:hypothetical protein BAY07_15495 [Elizabethkingia bruuniana]|nr:hypothetical protein BAY07_15495 [Elizabethkingia bruuniana]
MLLLMLFQVRRNLQTILYLLQLLFFLFLLIQKLLFLLLILKTCSKIFLDHQFFVGGTYPKYF